MAWPRYIVDLRGEDPFEVQTNAFDVLGLDPNTGFDFLFHQVHNALLRLEHPVPRNFRAFLEILESPVQVADDEATDPLDPTRPDPSDD